MLYSIKRNITKIIYVLCNKGHYVIYPRPGIIYLVIQVQHLPRCRLSHEARAMISRFDGPKSRLNWQRRRKNLKLAQDLHLKVGNVECP